MRKSGEAFEGHDPSGWMNICMESVPDGTDTPWCGKPYWVNTKDGRDGGHHSPKPRFELDRITPHQHREVTDATLGV